MDVLIVVPLAGAGGAVLGWLAARARATVEHPMWEYGTPPPAVDGARLPSGVRVASTRLELEAPQAAQGGRPHVAAPVHPAARAVRGDGPLSGSSRGGA